MYQLVERNERRARNHAMIFAIGLHIGLGALLYVQMDASKSASATNSPAKVNVARQLAAPAAKAVSQQP